jgi:triosephosphate isomerase
MAGNWKMNKNHWEAIALVTKLGLAFKEADHEAVDVVVVPPFTDIRSVQVVVESDKLAIGYGAQDVSQHESGAFTGEVSAPMLAKLGCGYVIVGHSERRLYHREDDELVNAKAHAAIGAGLTPIVCVGEGLEIRQSGDHVEHTLTQLAGALAKVTIEDPARLVVAYEPVWAIGTGEVATPGDAQEVCAAIRGRLGELLGESVAAGVRVLYGGSVKSKNIAGIMAEADIDGALVGGASLEADEFVRICRYRDLPV